MRTKDVQIRIPIDNSGDFDGAPHTWFLQNLESRRIGEVFAETPEKFKLVSDDTGDAFCRFYALDQF